jgi:predicted dinucleotide-binding enzyme
MEKIGVLGSGDVGRVLSAGFASLGHQVMLGSREPDSDKLEAWRDGAKVATGTFEETARFGELLVLATLWTGTRSALDLAGPANFDGKILIDVTNPLDFSKGVPPSLALGHTDSGGEQVQRWLPGARVVKAWNTVGNANMIRPQLPGGPPDMFICGNDAGAKTRVRQILGDFGWPAVDIGGIEGARELEPMCILWVKIAVATGTWTHAFKVLRR